MRVVARDPAAAARLGARPDGRGRRRDLSDHLRVAPVLRVADVAPGAHVTSVGFAPPGGELDPALAPPGACSSRRGSGVRAPARGLRRTRGPRPATRHRARRVLAGRAPDAPVPTRSRSIRPWATSPRTPRRPSSSIAPPSTPASADTWTSDATLVVVRACARARPSCSACWPPRSPHRRTDEAPETAAYRCTEGGRHTCAARTRVPPPGRRRARTRMGSGGNDDLRVRPGIGLPCRPRSWPCRRQSQRGCTWGGR